MSSLPDVVPRQSQPPMVDRSPADVKGENSRHVSDLTSRPDAGNGGDRLRGVPITLVLPSLGIGGAERQAFLLGRHLAAAERASVTFVSLGGLGRTADMCEQAGMRYCQFLLRHEILQSRVSQLTDIFRFIVLLRRLRVRVLLPYCMFQNVLCGLTWRLGGARVCIWNQRDEGRSRLEPVVERMALRRTRCFVSNSTHGAEFLVQTLGVDPGRVHVIHNGLELERPVLDRNAWRSKAGIPEGAFAACMVANLHGFKDHQTLVTAWRAVVDRLGQRGQDARLLLAGRPGDRYEAIRRQVESEGLADAITFLGEVSDVAGLLRAVDLSVFSSYAEGIPNAVLEAMAAGLAVVATDYPGIREAVGTRGEALLARPRSPDHLAELIVTAATNRDLRASLGEAGRTRVSTEFGLKAMCDRMVQRILAESAG